MRSFRELATTHLRPLENPSVSLRSGKGQVLKLKLDKKEIITEAGFDGQFDPWIASLCELVVGKSLSEAQGLRRRSWEEAFGKDQLFWDLWGETSELIWWSPLELLRATLDLYRGAEGPYEVEDPLVCMCFGVRESEVLAGIKTRAGLACRSCGPELERLKNLGAHRRNPRRRFLKDFSHSDWILMADEKLAQFPNREEWQMEVLGVRGGGIVIGHRKKVSQREEEEMAVKLQDFLRSALGSDLSFFLRRS